MQLFKFSGKVFFGSNSLDRMQVYVTDLETNKEYRPIITSKNKMFNKFYNKRINHKNKTSDGFLFSANLTFPNYSGALKNVVVYTEEEFTDNFAERLI